MPGCWCVGGARDTGPRRGLAAFSPGGPSSLLPAAGGSWCSYDCAWVTSAKTLFPKIVTFIGPGGVKVGLRLFPRHSLAPADLLLNLRHLTLSSQGAEHVPRQEDGGFRPSRNSVLCPCFPRVLGPEASFCADRLDQGEGSSVGVGKCKEKGRNAGCAQSRSSSAPAAAVPPPPAQGWPVRGSTPGWPFWATEDHGSATRGGARAGTREQRGITSCALHTTCSSLSMRMWGRCL